MQRIKILFLLILCCFCCATAAATKQNHPSRKPMPRQWDEIILSFKPHQLSRLPLINQVKFDKLIYRGGLHLDSNDERFGGYSGLHVSKNGTRLLALSDKATLLRAQIGHDQEGYLNAISNAEIARLPGKNNTPLERAYRDSEGLEVISELHFAVSFERRPRIDLYRFNENGDPAFVRNIVEFKQLPELRSNRSLEGLASLSQNQFLTTSERSYINKEGTQFNAILVENTPEQTAQDTSLDYFTIPVKAPLKITGIDISNGYAYLVERYFSRRQGLVIEIAKTPISIEKKTKIELTNLASFTSLYDIDNFEGISVRRTEDNRTFLYIISDDNFGTRQKTLLLQFEIIE